MASAAKTIWDIESREHLDQLEELYAAAAELAARRRWSTEHLHHGLFVSLVALFQAYCKGLHDETVEAILGLVDPRLSATVRKLARRGRRLDQQTPRANVLGNDFGLLGISLIPALREQGTRAEDDLLRLDLLIDFRNATTHGDLSEVGALVSSGKIEPTLQSFRDFRISVNRLVHILDKTVADTLADTLKAPPPW